jgi:hypothetical protein
VIRRIFCRQSFGFVGGGAPHPEIDALEALELELLVIPDQRHEKPLLPVMDVPVMSCACSSVLSNAMVGPCLHSPLRIAHS